MDARRQRLDMLVFKMWELHADNAEGPDTEVSRCAQELWRPHVGGFPQLHAPNKKGPTVQLQLHGMLGCIGETLAGGLGEASLHRNSGKIQDPSRVTLTVVVLTGPSSAVWPQVCPWGSVRAGVGRGTIGSSMGGNTEGG